MWTNAGNYEHYDAKLPNAYQNKRMIETMKEVNPNEVPLLQFEEVAVATNNFHSSNKLGEGGYGPMYKVIIMIINLKYVL